MKFKLKGGQLAEECRARIEEKLSGVLEQDCLCNFVNSSSLFKPKVEQKKQ
jgi:hypothetical protein